MVCGQLLRNHSISVSLEVVVVVFFYLSSSGAEQPLKRVSNMLSGDAASLFCQRWFRPPATATAHASASVRCLFPLVRQETLAKVVCSTPAAEMASLLGPICAAKSPEPCSTTFATTSSWCGSPAASTRSDLAAQPPQPRCNAAGQSTLLEKLVEELPAAQAMALRSQSSSGCPCGSPWRSSRSA